MKRAPYLNLNAFCRFIGPKNLGKVLIDDELVTCLLDNGAQLNFITPAYAQERGMDIMSLDYLAEEIGGAIPHISGIGGISVEPIGFIMMNVKVPGITGYDEDQIAIVMDDSGMTEWLVILGTPTIYWVIEVIKESEIFKLAVPWACKVLLLLRLAIWWRFLFCCFLSVLNFWGMFVRVYPKIVQGLTFLNSVKHITIILARCTS